MDVKEIREGAKDIWEKIEAFSESMLGDGPMGIFKMARNSEPTKTMLAREKEYAVTLITEYIQAALSTIDPEAIKRTVLLDAIKSISILSQMSVESSINDDYLIGYGFGVRDCQIKLESILQAESGPR